MDVMMMKKYRRICATVDLDAIRSNVENIRACLKPETQVIAVVKADGYGHGAVLVAHELEHLPGVSGFAAATAEEALILRGSGIRKPILVLGYTFPDSFEKLIREDIRLTVFREDMLPGLQAAAGICGKSVPVHIKVDTGMSRIGIEPDEKGLSFIRKCMETPGLQIEGIFTHLARADERDKSGAKEQLSRFLAFCDKVENSLGYRIPLKHCANSAAAMEMPDACLDAVRAGVAIYGLWPSEEMDHSNVQLSPALSLQSSIVFLKDLPAGRQVSYGGTWQSQAPCRIATIPVGYGDGYPRSLSNKGYVLIRGKKAPIRGRVCMDQMMVDVTDIPEAQVDDEVTLIGRDGGEIITMEQLGELSGRFNYELACCLNARVPIIYIRDKKIVSVKDNF